MTGGILEGKLGLVMGVANRRSLAWAIAEGCHAAGARLALTYAGERLENEVRTLSGGLSDPLVLPCDVARDEEIAAALRRIDEVFGGLDFVVHAIAYAEREDLARPYVETTRAGYHVAQDISAYSLVGVCREAAPLLAKRGGGSVVTLSYVGASRVVPGYNVMGVAKAALEASVRYLANDLGPSGIRVNAVSAGPVKTLAARGIRDFSKMLEQHREEAPLRRNIEPSEVADATVFLVGPGSRAITGQVLHVDAGSSIL